MTRDQLQDFYDREGGVEQTFWFFRRVIAPLLFGGVVLDALLRMGYQPSRMVLLSILLLTVVAWRIVFPLERSRRRTFSVSLLVAVGLSTLLILGDLIRLSNEPGGLRSIFATRVHYHEDNSSWIALGNFSSVQGVPSGKFGHQLSILHALSRTVASIVSWFGDIEPGSWGASSAAVTVTYIALLGIVPFLILPMFRLVLSRTRSLAASTLVACFLLLFLVGFVREVRTLGHLSAGVAVILIVSSVNLLISNRHQQTLSNGLTIEGLLIFALVMNVWFPLQPLSFMLALIAVTRMWRTRPDVRKQGGRFWLRLILLPAPIFLVFLFRYVKGIFFSEAGVAAYSQLLSAPGATYETYDSLLILLAGVVGLACIKIKARKSLALTVGVTLLSYAVAVRFADALASLGFDYGSTKLIWVLIPPMIFLFFGIFVGESVNVTPKALQNTVVGTVLVAFVVLLNSMTFFQSLRSFQPFLPFGDRVSFLEREADGMDAANGLEGESSLIKWDALNGLEVGLSPHELPTSCIAIDGLTPTPQWGFEPYRCTRKLAEASLVEGIQRESEGQPVDILLRRFPLLQASLTETIVGLVYSGNDLTRQLLILDQTGGVVRTERILDYIVQVTSYRDLMIKFSSSESGSKRVGETDSLPGSVDHVDLEIGTISGWVDPAVTSLSFVGSWPEEVSSVQRTEREDVAQLQGARSRYSGFSFTSSKINQALRCVVAHSSDEEHRVLWSAEEGSC